MVQITAKLESDATIARAIVWAGALLVSGCTTGLATRGDVRSTNSANATAGLPYSLPMAQFDITVTHTITQCFTPDAAGSPTATPELIIATTYAATPVSVPGETYLIDPEALSGPLKTSDLSITNFPTGTLQSINASVQDRTGALISAGLSATLRGISIIAGVPTVAPTGAAALSGEQSVPVQMVCGATTPTLLAALKTATDNLKAAQSILDATNEEILALAARVADETATEAQITRLGVLRGLVPAQTSTLTLAEAALTRAKSALSVAFSVRWPTAFAETSHTAFSPSDEALSRFRRLLTVGPAGTGGRPCATIPDDADARLLATSACLNQQIGVAAALRRAVAPAGTIARRAIATSATENGMYVRPPVRGHLILCRGVGNCAADGPVGGNVWSSAEVWLPQLGQLRLLRYRNREFEDNSLALTLDQAGNIVSVSYKSSDAAAVETARVVDDALGALGEFDTRVRNNNAARRERARQEVIQDRADELAAIQHELTVTNANRTLDMAQNPPDTEELAAIQAETALANARAARAQAELAERAARLALEAARAEDAEDEADD